MATWIAHLRVAKELILKLDVDKALFYAGNLAPDCGKINADCLTYTPPKALSHYSENGLNSGCDHERFFTEFLSETKAEEYEKRSFLLGYYSHLATDRIWGEEIFDRKRREYEGNFCDTRALLSAFKGDWYALDKAFLEQSKGFPPIDDAANANIGDFLPFFPADIIKGKILSIGTFYAEKAYEPNRENKFLTKEEMDVFVIKASAKILNLLEKHSLIPALR